MIEEPENEFGIPADQAPLDQAALDRAALDRASAATPVNPYQAPAYHPQAASGVAPAKRDEFSVVYVATAIGLLVAALLITVFTQGLGLPLLMAAVGGIIRASAMVDRQKDSPRRKIPAEILLITSTFVTLLLLFCCAIAFATICTGGVLAMDGQSPATYAAWSTLTGGAALVAFVVMFIRSIKWGA